MNIAEHLESLRKSKTEAQTRMNEVAQKSIDEQRSMNDGEQEEFDTIKAEIDTLNADIKRFSELLEMQKQAAEPVADQAEASANATANGGTVYRVAKNTQKLEPGIGFARAAKCLALGYLQHQDAVQIAQNMYKDHESIVKATQRMVTKADVSAATTGNDDWAGNLVGDESNVFADFIEYLRPQTILGQFGTNGRPALRTVPFRVALVGQTDGGDGYWVGEGKPKPLTKFAFSRTTLEPMKVANIAVASMEVVRDSSPSADVIIRDQLAAALRERMDKDFIDPSNSGTSGVKPASILNAPSGISSSGNDADAIRADLRALYGAFIAANNAPTSGVFIMPSTLALTLSLMQNPLGQREFPGIAMSGGTFNGLPTIVSEYVDSDVVALVNASDIYRADEGGVDVDMSTEASLEMSDAPTQDQPTGANLVSLWQNNLIGFRAERTINWAARRDSAAAYLKDVAWGEEDTTP